MILAIVNRKGGVGKTTTAVNLAAALSSTKCRVLVVDLDAQSHATISVGLEPVSPSMAEIFIDERPLLDAIQATHSGFDVAIASSELANADVALATEIGRENRLREALRPTLKSYDHVIIDCPPSLGLLAINAMTAADSYLVPIVPEYLAGKGVESLLSTAKRIRKGLGRVARLAGFVLVRKGYQTRATHEVADQLRSAFGAKVFKTEIPQDARLSEAPSFGKTIFEHAPSSPGALAYKALARELLQKTKGKK